MAQLLSDEEFLSTSEKQPAATKVASAGKLLSDEEFLLGEEPFMTEARKGPSAMSVVKDIGGYTLGVLGQVEDMLAAVPRIASIFGAAGTAGVAAAKGESAKTVAGSALAYQESFLPEWTQGAFGKIATALGPEAKNYYENNGIAKFLGKFGEAVTEGSEKIENKTGIPAEASQLLVNTLMDYLGSKGVIAGVKHSIAKRGALEEARQAKLYEKRQAPYQPPPEEVARQAEAAETLQTEQALAKEQLKRAEGPPPEVDLAKPSEIFKRAKAEGYKVTDKDARIISTLFERVKQGETPVIEMEGVEARGIYDAAKGGLPSLDEMAKWTKEARGKALLAAGLTAGGVALANDWIDQEQLVGIGLIGVTAASRGKLREALKAAPEHLRDKVLVDLARAGNEAALEKIYKDNAAPLERSIATYKLPPGIDAQDVVARVFEKFFTDTLKRPQDAVGGFRGDAKVSSFLYGAVRNQAIKAMEKGRLDETSLHEAVGAEGRPLEETVGTTATSPETIALNTALGQKMQAALDKLPEHQRAIVDKILLEGKDYATAAAELGVPEGTIRSGLSRAKETLQYSLREYRNLEAGKADPELLGKIALVGGAAAMGAALNDSSPLTGGLVGAGAAFAGLAALKLSPTRAVQSIKSAFAPDTRIRINHLADAHDAGIAQAARAIWQQQQDVAKIAPKAADRIVITNAIQQNTVGNLPPALQSAARQAKQFFAALGEAGQQANVLKGLIDNYVTNLWDLNGKNKAIWDSILNRAGGPSMSPESRFALKRSIANLEVGKRLGLTPLTEDVAEIMGIYGNSLARTLENKTLLDALKTERDPLSGQKLLLPEGKSPHSYVVIDHPQMRGTRVHPDIAPSMRFIFDNSNPGVVARGLEGLNTAIKRSAVSFSLFHAKALIDAFIGASNNPLRAAKTAVTSAFGVDKYLQMLRKGGAGDLVDDALKGGLKITFEKGKLVDEDIGGSFYAGLKLAQRGLDAVIPGAGLPVKAVAKINHLVDTFMWERLHAGMKLNVFADKLAVITESNAKAHARNPSKVPLQTKAELSAEAASFTNDIFGGLNWRRLAEEATTHWGRDVALAAYSSKGRRVLQLLMFAPDWTISTTRAATRAFGALAGYKAGSGLRGLLEPQNATDLHRQYIMRSALYYAIVGDGINYALSGHHLWENRDPTTIDMGDGRTMQWSKHSMEPIHWVTKPGQQALNKLGFVPKELANQMLGTEYLSAYGSAPKMDTSPLGRASHMGRSMLPIAAQQAFGSQASPGSGLAGFLGAPIYGKTYKEKQAAKEARKRLRQTPAYKRELAERKRERDRQRQLGR